MILVVAVSALLISACAGGNTDTVAVLVEVDRPEGVIDDMLEAGLLDVAAIDRAVTGLQRKYVTRTDQSFGGVYLWADRKAAETFFSAAWQERIRQTYGVSPTLTWFEVPVGTSGGSLGEAGGEGVVAIVQVPAPWYAPDALIRRRMKHAVPLYTNVRGLDFKYFIIADGGRVGGIHLWTDQAAADAFYDAKWRTRTRQTYGEDADLQFFAAPVTVINAVAQE